MKILIVSCFSPNRNVIAARRIQSWAKTWSDVGHEVTVLTVKEDDSPNSEATTDTFSFSILEVNPGWIYRLLKRAVKAKVAPLGKVGGPENIKTRLLKSLKARGLFSSTRMPDPFDLWLFPAWKKVKNEQWDIVVTSYGPYAPLVIGFLLKLFGKTGIWVGDFRDLWTQNSSFKGFFPFTLIEKILEYFLISQMSGVVTVSPALEKKVRRNGVPSAVIYNGYDSLELGQAGIATEVSDEQIIIRYTGSIYPQNQSPEALFEALLILPPVIRKKFKIEFYGPNVNVVTQYKFYSDLRDQIFLLGQVEHSTSISLQRSADILLFMERKLPPEEDGILTGKIFEYLNSEVYILATGIDENSFVGKLIKDSNAGRAFGYDSESISLMLGNVAADKNKLRVLRNREAFEKFNRTYQAKRMLQFINSLV